MRSVLLNTNLFLLLVVGLHDRTLVGRHRRTRDFIPEDFDLLVDSIDRYEVLWVTSHCLAEVSNLLRQTHERQARELMQFFQRFMAAFRESHMPKEILANSNVFVRLGVADTSIVAKSRRVSCVLTTDLDLYNEILRENNVAINFNHLRARKYLG